MEKIQVNPNILKWARETANLTLDDAAKRLQTSPKRLLTVEEGSELPSRPLLLRMSKQYHRSLLAFYLEEPPKKGNRGQDFRMLPDDYAQIDEGLVDAMLRDVHARQRIVRSALENEDEEIIPLSIVGSVTQRDGVKNVSNYIQEYIDFNLETFRANRTFRHAFTYLRSQAEAAGFFVLLIGNLGSHHTKINAESFRGFAIADPIAPFLIINDQDSEAAWSFTLLHELAHIWLGQTGISGGRTEMDIEQFCNDVASAILLPTKELRELNVNDRTDFQSAITQINEFSSTRNVSRAMVAYKLHRVGAISRSTWEIFRTEFHKQWVAQQNEQREKARNQLKAPSPSYYGVKRHRTGKALVELVARLINSGELTSTKAGKVLGVKPRNIFELIRPKLIRPIA